MSGVVVNLRQHRKRQSRQAAEMRAEENRLAHGRTKAEKAQLAAEQDAQQRHVEGHRRDRDA